MNLKELISNTEWLSVEYVLLELYPEIKEHVEDYKKVFHELKELKLIKTNIILEIDRLWENGDETNYANVYGYDPTLPDNSITKGIAIDFRPWSEWLEYEIGIDAKEEWTELEMIGHALIEMTLDGFTQEEIQENKQNIIGKALKIQDEYFRNKGLDN